MSETRPDIKPDTEKLDSADLSQFELLQRNQYPLLSKAVTFIGVALAVMHIWFNTLATLPELWISATHFAGFSLMCVLTYPAARSLANNKAALWFDVAIGLTAVACLVYIPLAEDALYERGVTFVASDWVFSILAILIVLELIRRTMGGLSQC